MKKHYITLSLTLALLLCGCVTPPAKRAVVFDPKEFEPYAGRGDSLVTGQAFLKTRSGEVRFGAGCEVIMVPITAYTKEIHDRSVLGGVILEPTDSRYALYRRKTIADGNGNFEFRDIPAGEYYLSCEIKWEYSTQYGLMKTGGVAIGQTRVKTGETTRVILTR